MDEINVDVMSLYKVVKQMRDDGMDTVTVRLVAADGDGDDALPACMEFEASKKSEPFSGVVYDEVEAVPD